MPLLAPGTGLQVVKGPLTGLNVLSCENVSQLHQMVSEVADVLEISSESPAVYQRHIEAILYLAHPVDLESTNGKTPKDKGDPAVKISHSVLGLMFNIIANTACEQLNLCRMRAMS